MTYIFIPTVKIFSSYLVVCSYCHVQRRTIAVDLVHNVYGSGTGVPIIVMHGLLGNKRNWRGISETLATNLETRVVTVDMRNHGDSPHALPHTYPELALDIAQLIGKLGFGKVNLIGHSMGGRTGMVLALNQNDMVRRLIVVDISPISTSTSLSTYIPQMLKIMISLKFDGMKLHDAKKLTTSKLIEAGLATKAEDVHFLNTNIVVKSNNIVGWKCNVDALLAHFGDIASFPSEVSGKQFPGNTLFIAGKLSNFVLSEDLPGIRSFFPAAQLHYVEGAGHNVHFDATSKFINLVTTFLKSA